MGRVILTAVLDGESWKIAAPPGTVVRPDAGPAGRLRAEIPGVLSRLGVWELIEAARVQSFGLRVIGYSPVGWSRYITCLWDADIDTTEEHHGQRLLIR